MGNKTLDLGVLEFKALGGERTFSCYGNVKGSIDHALDRVVDGAYRDSIAAHKAAGTMPKFFWMHNPWDTPVGVWTAMEEDSKGLYLEGKFSNTPKGNEIYELYKDNALDSFSIGYRVNDEKWNSSLGCNDLIKVDIREISAVTFACNEESRLVEIKSKLGEGKVLTKAELRALLESVPAGLSKRQIERITADYKPSGEIDLKTLESYNFFK
ncbi:prohead protease [Aeromonas phage vB_AveS_KLEA5]|nr:prohead protease [Aeromonas phage vB_AveS_KLEA5]